MYRKGRCRHGHKCTFAHDTDVKTGKTAEPKYDAESQIKSKEKAAGTGPVIQLSAPVREFSPPKVHEPFSIFMVCVVVSVMDPNKFILDPDPEFLPNLNPEQELCC